MPAWDTVVNKVPQELPYAGRIREDYLVHVPENGLGLQQSEATTCISVISEPRLSPSLAELDTKDWCVLLLQALEGAAGSSRRGANAIKFVLQEVHSGLEEGPGDRKPAVRALYSPW